MSTFTWIDHSEKQRRQILEAIDLFREKDTRDELGLAGIRDAFSDMLFPGTGSLQTRARYFFFVPGCTWDSKPHAFRRPRLREKAERSRSRSSNGLRIRPTRPARSASAPARNFSAFPRACTGTG